jgi:hypothetical protein
LGEIQVEMAFTADMKQPPRPKPITARASSSWEKLSPYENISTPTAATSISTSCTLRGP